MKTFLLFFKQIIRDITNGNKQDNKDNYNYDDDNDNDVKTRQPRNHRIMEMS